MIKILKENGDKKIRISVDNYGIEFGIMTNGHQYNVFYVDDALLILIKEAINEYFGIVEVITQQDLDNALKAQRIACVEAFDRNLEENYTDICRAILNARIEE